MLFCLKQTQHRLVSLQKQRLWCTRRTRNSSCVYLDCRRKTATHSRQTVRDQLLREARDCSSSHSVKCASHSMGDHTKTRLNIQSSIGRLEVSQIPKLGAKPTASPTVTTSLHDGGRITENAGVQSRCEDGLFYRDLVGNQELHCESVAELSQALGMGHQLCVQLRNVLGGKESRRI